MTIDCTVGSRYRAAVDFAIYFTVTICLRCAGAVGLGCSEGLVEIRSFQSLKDREDAVGLVEIVVNWNISLACACN